jgi:undecaprenyl-diphosphatase
MSTGTSLHRSDRMLQFINRRDHALMRRINQWPAPRWVRLLMISATRGGDGWLWYPLGVLIFLSDDPERIAAVLAGISATSVGLCIYSVVKRATRRTRPCLIEPSIWAGILPPDQYSFPSGHAIAAFANAVAVGLFYPALMPALLLSAVLIALSRILLGMHFLSDVVVGALIGTSLGYAAFHLVQFAF